MALTRWRLGTTCLLLFFSSALAVWSAEPVDLAVSPLEVRTELFPRTPLTGAQLTQVLDEPVAGVAWSNASLRRVVRRVSDAYDIAILCDRRIDPTRKINLNAENLSLRTVLERVAADAGCESRRVGNAIYFAPQEAATVVRTVVALRRQELGELSKRRVTILTRPESVGWTDLTEPVEILDQISRRFDLVVENPERLPHDLWAGSRLPEMDAVEMLTLVLIQYDLTFEWAAEENSIRLVSLPDDPAQIVIERAYPTFQQLDETLARWKETAGLVDLMPNGRQVVVRGPLELHEVIEQVLAGRSISSDRRKMQPGKGGIATVPLARREFTLTVSRVPASAIMSKLEESGITFEFDADSLANAGVDLNTPVSVKVEQADAETFFRTVFQPLKVAVELDGVTVKLRPASR